MYGWWVNLDQFWRKNAIFLIKLNVFIFNSFLLQFKLLTFIDYLYLFGFQLFVLLLLIFHKRNHLCKMNWEFGELSWLFRALNRLSAEWTFLVLGFPVINAAQTENVETGNEDGGVWFIRVATDFTLHVILSLFNGAQH